MKHKDEGKYEVWNQKLSKLPVKYNYEEDGASFSINLNETNKYNTIRRMDHASFTQTVESDKVFNRGIKRGNTILSTGDKPRFALLNTLPEEKLDPANIKLGDGRIRITCGEVDHWLDESDEIKTVFHPSCTEYFTSFNALPGVELHLLISQAEDWGAIAKLSVTNRTTDFLAISAKYSYGGMASCPRTLTAAYFPPDMADTAGNIVEASNQLCKLSHETFPQQVFVGSIPKQSVVISDLKAHYTFELRLTRGQTKSVSLIAGHSLAEEDFIRHLDQKLPEHWIKESKGYYDRILAGSVIRTPNAVLDSGFKTALLNHEYAYTAPAWLEGVHYWGAFWNNNFQISAAISLGQITRARNALELFGIREKGPGCLGSTTGKPVINENHQREEWLPYYLNALIHYYGETGDQELLERIWTPLLSSIQYLWEARDKNDNSLLDWHLACNPFMYQADHLGMPGDAASPSLMMAGMMEKLSIIARKIGKMEEAKEWEQLSEEMNSKVVELLWNKDAGVFYNHIDLQEIKHMCHYYTDHVYPTLYTSLSQEYGWQSLKFLHDTLWLDDSFGHRTLMRVGSLKPSIFGNDNVMPTQMCEAAHAYFIIGDAEKGLKLLESVALAATVFTEAPGNFPERMGDDGKGEANYIFGNPIGSFLHSTIAGLFGLSVTYEGETMCWSPGFPRQWDDAEIQLTYVTAKYKADWAGSIRRENYVLAAATPKKLFFKVHLEPGEIVNIRHNDNSLEYTLKCGLGKTIVDVSFPTAVCHEITIEYKPFVIEVPSMKSHAVNSTVVWTFSSDVEEVKDVQESLTEFKLNGKEIHAVAGDTIGKHSLYVKLKGIWAYFPLHFEIKPHFTIAFHRSFYDEERESLFVETQITTPETGSAVGQFMLELNVSNHIGSTIFPISGGCETLQMVEIPFKEFPAEGVAIIVYKLQRGKGEVVFTGKDTIVIVGLSAKTKRKLQMLRDQRTLQLDLTSQFNASAMRASSRWRHSGAMHHFDANALTLGTGIMATSAGEFKLPPNEYCMLLVEYGYSDSYTRDTIPSDKERRIRVPIEMRCSMVSMLYANEVESRHTGAEVGSIQLQYEDGEAVRIPLIIGGNVDAMFTHFAKDTLPVKIEAEGFSGEDYLNILRLSCHPEKVLKALEIQVDAPDVHIGILGINICQSN